MLVRSGGLSLFQIACFNQILILAVNRISICPNFENRKVHTRKRRKNHVTPKRHEENTNMNTQKREREKNERDKEKVRK